MKEALENKRIRFRDLVAKGIKSKTELAIKTSVSARVIEFWLWEDFQIGSLPENGAADARTKLEREQDRDTRTKKKLERGRFREMYQGRRHTIQEIAAALGVCRTTVNNWRKQDFPEGGSDWRYKDFEFLYEAKRFTIERIADMIYCSRANALRYLARYNRERGLLHLVKRYKPKKNAL